MISTHSLNTSLAITPPAPKAKVPSPLRSLCTSIFRRKENAIGEPFIHSFAINGVPKGHFHPSCKI
ncbi:unnamed protein product [Tuber melanosporum]|uniref:(Perigord truffle) hypothetical protein n=1 Tax=Tuber melanosporum (strain Mel28) TaxID=656061 RepID=D5GHX1_TUBMM|nr:uncharacterized protein GSTUM_00008158001 [Tuber melanosporum]CAZ84114.1 unnamed protein product [Tuber melanosporum]